VHPLGRRSFGRMNVFGVMTQRNIAASASVAQYESFAVQIKGS